MSSQELTAREREVLAGLVAGLDVTEVADFLVISPMTARTHVKHVHEKTGTHNLGQIVAWGLARPELLSCDLPQRQLRSRSGSTAPPDAPSPA